MSKVPGKLAQRYARALLRSIRSEHGDLALEERDGASFAQKLGAQLAEFARVWSENAELSDALLNPMFEREQRQAALKALAERAGLPELLVRFLLVLFERDRIVALPDVAARFRELADEAAAAIEVSVTTARPVTGDEARHIETQVTPAVAGHPRFVWSVDPSLIGGMVVAFKGKVLDGSVRGRVERIEQMLLG